MTSSERRLAPRAAVQIRAVALVLGEPVARFDPEQAITTLRGSEFEAIIVDLSVTGAGLASTHAPPLMARLSLRFELSGFGSVLAACIVMWRQQAGSARAMDDRATFGVRFEALDLSARKAILAIVTRA